MASPGCVRHKIREKKFGGDTKLGSPGVSGKILCDAKQSIKFKQQTQLFVQQHSVSHKVVRFSKLCHLYGVFFFNIFDYKESNNALAIKDLVPVTP